MISGPDQTKNAKCTMVTVGDNPLQTTGVSNRLFFLAPGDRFCGMGVGGPEPPRISLPSGPAGPSGSRVLPNHVIVNLGPPPPSGGTHVIFSKGSLMSQVLQWTQFEKLSFILGLPVVSSISISYTLAGQNLRQGF
jgi:hypothetical protein